MPLIISNRIIIDAARTTITVQDKYMLNYGPSFDSPMTEILRASVSLVLFPGDSIDFQLPESFSNEVECIIESRLEFSEAWPFPAVLPTNDVLSIENDTESNFYRRRSDNSTTSLSLQRKFTHSVC